MQKGKNLISEVGVNLLCQFCVIMDVKCSFSSLVGGSCSYDPRDRSRSTEVIPFLNCKRDIAGHKSSLSITDVETEIELILGRVSTSFSSELNLSELTICPRHRSSLGIGWRRGSNLCRVPPPISKPGGQAQKKRKGRKRTWQKCLLFDMEETGNFYSSWFRYVYIIFHLFQPNRPAVKWRSNLTLQLKHFVSTFLFFLFFFFNSFIN